MTQEKHAYLGKESAKIRQQGQKPVTVMQGHTARRHTGSVQTGKCENPFENPSSNVNTIEMINPHKKGVRRLLISTDFL